MRRDKRLQVSLTKILYSPDLGEVLVRRLFRVKVKTGKKITQIVREAIDQYLVRYHLEAGIRAARRAKRKRILR